MVLGNYIELGCVNAMSGVNLNIEWSLYKDTATSQ